MQSFETLAYKLAPQDERLSVCLSIFMANHHANGEKS